LRTIKHVAVLATALALVAIPTTASAHVTLQPSEAPAGGFTRVDVRVPNEQDDAGTTKVDVQFPDGFAFVSHEPVDGWAVRVSREKLDTPIEGEGDEQITEQVSRVTWTAQGNERIGPGQFRDFGLSVRMPDEPGQALTFKANQTYENGEVVRWIGPPDSEEPAPRVTLTAAAEEHGAAEEGEEGAEGAEGAAAESEDEEDDDDSERLSIAALIVGGLGLVVGGAAFARGRRRP
jgi:uncharacterized protein